MWFLEVAAKFFTVITAFGMTSQGVRREEAIRFGLKGSFLVVFISVLISITNRSFYFFTLTQDMAITFILSFIVLRMIFYFLLKR